ncbi:MAG TPA: PKD domain-containing protein, partial [Actinomycetota bacterium]
FTVTNDGFETAASVSATVSMPENARGIPFVSGGSVCTAGTAEARVCALGTLNNGESRTITVSGSFGAAGAATLSIAATSATADPDASNNTASVSMTVSRVSANLQLRLIRVTSPVNVSDFTDYVIEVKNAGPDPVGGVRLTDTVPATLGSAQAAGSNSSSVNCFFGSTQVTCNDGPTVCSTPIPSPAPGALATCTVSGPLPSGGTRYFRFVGRPLVSGTIQNLATVSGLELDDPDTSDNTLTTSIVVNATADLALSANAPGSAPLGEEFDVELSVENNGPDAVTDATTTTTLPTGVALVSAAGCTGTTTVVCPLGSIAVDATATKTIRLRGTAAGNAAIATTVDSGIHDHVAANDAVTRTVTILPNAPPTADAGGPYSVDEGASVSLAGTGTDPNGDALTFAWDLDGDGTFESSGATVQFSAGTTDGPGSRTVGLRVCDAPGACATDTATVQVENVAPQADLDAPAAADEGGQFTVALSSPRDPSSADTAAGFEYAFDCGRGSGFGAFGPGAGATCTAGGGPGTQVVRGRIRDKDGGVSEQTAQVAIRNLPPTVSLHGAPATTAEGSTVVLTASGNDPGGDALTYSWRAFRGGVHQPALDGSGATYAFSPNDDGAWTVRVVASDGDGGSADDGAAIAVTNVAPAATLAAADSVDEGSAFTVSLGGATDPSTADTAAGFEYAFDCGTGAGYGPFGPAASASCATDDDGTRAVRAKLRDKDGGEREYSASVAVRNVAPTARLTAPASVDGGSTFELALTGAADVSAADAAAGFAYAFDCGSGSGYGAFGAASSAQCPTDDDGTRTVRGKIRDKDGGESEYAATVEVVNVPPTCGPVSAPLAPSPVGTTVSVSAPIVDPEAADTHTGTIAWGDGTSSPAAVAGGVATAGHAYASPGVYTVTVDVADDDGGTASCVFRYVVVYDPSAGFVTGGGWVDSPAGAYTADPAAAGRASFGFVARYQRGATVPTGQTQFQFKAGRLDFHSTAYEWLVIAGARAKFKGTGEIGGVGGYSF